VTKALRAECMTDGIPVKTKKNEDFIILDDRYYILFNRIEGRYLLPEERYNENRVETAKKYGEAIGKLHKVLLNQEENIEVNDHNMYKIVVEWALPKTKSIMEQWGCPLPEEFYNNYLENFEEIYPELPKQIIHRDANPSNILFSNGEVSGFVDFEISVRYVRIFDPCYCATGILSEAEKVEEGFKKWPEILRGIIKGYDNICNLTKEERQAIPYVIYSIQMIFIAYLADKEDQRDVAMVNRKMLLWIWENKDKYYFE